MPNRDGHERLRVTMWDAGAASDCADPKRHGQLQLREDYAQACARHLQAVFQDVRPGQPYSAQPWEDLPEAVVCDRKMYEDFAAYLLSEYTFQASSKRKHLDSRS